MEARYHQGLVYYVFDILAPYPQLKHGVFARHASRELGGDLTFAFGRQAPESTVLASLSLAESALGLGPAVFVGQTHSANVYLCDPQKPYHPRSQKELISGYDALVTRPSDQNPGEALLIKLADCQGIILYHPQSQTLALAHSGWRGSVQNILGQTVSFLNKRFGLPPAELLAGISPSLGPCCAEFIHYEKELPEEFWRFQNPKNHYFDFWAISHWQLTQAGLKPQNIEIAGICTKCQPDFYSHRRGDDGRFALLAGIAHD
ncbi:MAG: polyphenol oxidase family protein [Deltaproteobacteria bacterium]|jgi:YfiH family protein|nr:polyphenol oxidase family protein [Deltaproteobacteria bacterium]